MSNVERFSQVIPANGILELPRGNLFILLSATAAINLRMQGKGFAEGVDGTTGGVRLRRVLPWDTIRLIGAAGTTCVYFIGSDETDEDLTEVFLQSTVIAGTTAVAEAPSATVSALADNALPAATTETIAANLLRRRITIGCLGTNTVGFRVKNSGGPALSGIEIQPGMYEEFRTTAALDIRNDDAAVATSYYIFEES